MTDRIVAPKQSSWLFMKDSHSVWVVRTAGLAIGISGPGRSQVCYQFASEDEMQRFQIGLGEQLAWTGWVLQASNCDRRTGGERRSPSRPHWAGERRASSRAAFGPLTLGIRRGTSDWLSPHVHPAGDSAADPGPDASRRLDGWTTRSA